MIKNQRSAWLLVIALLLPTIAAAAPVGTLSIANVSTGGVTVSATTIDWFPPVGGEFGQFSTGAPTSITYNPTNSTTATLTSTTNPFGQIRDINLNAGIIPNFIQFYSGTTLPAPAGAAGSLQTWPVFDLVGVVPGGAAQGALSNCAGVTGIGVSCSPQITVGANTFVSPFVLTNRGAYTDVSLGVNMVGRDATAPGLTSLWSGGFTTQVIEQGGVRLTPAAIQTIINSGGSITNTYSGTFTGSAIPEPSTIGLAVSGLALIVLGSRRRKKA